jgi:hypothetical protein
MRLIEHGSKLENKLKIKDHFILMSAYILLAKMRVRTQDLEDLFFDLKRYFTSSASLKINRNDFDIFHDGIKSEIIRNFVKALTIMETVDSDLKVWSVRFLRTPAHSALLSMFDSNDFNGEDDNLVSELCSSALLAKLNGNRITKPSAY